MVPQKILILWSLPTSYFLAAIRELLIQTGKESEITLVALPGNQWYPELLTKSNRQSINLVSYQAFKPRDYLNYNLILMSSWNFKKYREVARRSRRSCTIMSMDNQMRRTIKQTAFLASKIGPLYIRNIVDFVFVAGSRQQSYAIRIGFQADQILTGVYPYDDQLFFPQPPTNQKKQFCFIGRKVAAKGLDTLVAAYQNYRMLCVERKIQPWDLVIAGPGKLPRDIPIGVHEKDYLSPSEAAELMSSSQCFVLPSRFEPFGVVLTEAAASGCLLIASSAVGAADDLIEEGTNGFTFLEDSSDDLAKFLMRVTLFSEQENQDGRRESIIRAQQFTPAIWAKKLLETYADYSKKNR